MDNKPLISIITVCKNSEGTIEKTILSVLSQTYSNIEYIIIDGNSSDSTMVIVNGYKYSITKIISESDSGIYQAMNKGIALAKGEFILFLNADDRLVFESAIEKAVDFIVHQLKSDVFCGNLLRFHIDGTFNIWTPKKVTELSLYRGSLPHPATFFRKDSFHRYGNYNESFAIAGDYEWFLRAFLKHHAVFTIIPQLITMFFEGGISTLDKYKLMLREEISKTHSMYFTPAQLSKLKIKKFIRKQFK